MQFRYLPIMFLLGVMGVGVSPSVDAMDNDTWADISDVGVYTLIGSALLTPVVREDWQGFPGGL